MTEELKQQHIAEHEWQVDPFAKDYGYGLTEASGLKKISAQTLSNLTQIRS